MQAAIHPSAVIDPSAKLGRNISVGAYSIIGGHAIIGDDAKIHSHVVIDGHTTIGKGTEIFPFAVLGCPPQHTRYKNEPSRLMIGANCVIREHVTMHPGTAIDSMETIVGDNGLFLQAPMLRMIVLSGIMLFLPIMRHWVVMRKLAITSCLVGLPPFSNGAGSDRIA